MNCWQRPGSARNTRREAPAMINPHRYVWAMAANYALVAAWLIYLFQ
jgi:hypothetical protein